MKKKIEIFTYAKYQLGAVGKAKGMIDEGGGNSLSRLNCVCVLG